MMTTVSIIWLAIPPGLTFGEESGVSPKAFENLQITKLGIGLSLRSRYYGKVWKDP